jgi:hypothetical protein
MWFLQLALKKINFCSFEGNISVNQTSHAHTIVCLVSPTLCVVSTLTAHINTLILDFISSGLLFNNLQELLILAFYWISFISYPDFCSILCENIKAICFMSCKLNIFCNLLFQNIFSMLQVTYWIGIYCRWVERGLVPNKGRVFLTGSGRLINSEHDASITSISF